MLFTVCGEHPSDAQKSTEKNYKNYLRLPCSSEKLKACTKFQWACHCHIGAKRRVSSVDNFLRHTFWRHFLVSSFVSETRLNFGSSAKMSCSDCRSECQVLNSRIFDNGVYSFCESCMWKWLSIFMHNDYSLASISLPDCLRELCRKESYHFWKKKTRKNWAAG